MNYSKTFFLFVLLGLIITFGCSESFDDNSQDTRATYGPKWLIPTSLIFDGGPGLDGIPALSFPPTAKIGDTELDYLNDDELVLVYRDGATIKVYPHKILDWHEIINDNIGDKKVAITYCPLTGTGIGWDRVIDGKETTFGVSGLLYETNLMPYDRETVSYWSQMADKCVNGQKIGTIPEFHNLIQMSYGATKKLLPTADVITEKTGYDRDYSFYPYNDYNLVNNTQILYPISNFDDRLPLKEFVRGVFHDGEAVAFRFPSEGRSITHDMVANKDLVVVTDKENDIIVSFFIPTVNEVPLEFSLIEDENSVLIMQDQFGSNWDIFGVAVDGPNRGMSLEVPYSYLGYWFAIANFYPEVRIYGE